jgi:ceramide glucosyltransferase
MAHALSLLLLACSALGVSLLAVQIGSALRHLRTPPPVPTRFPPISILKPLCGIDDRLQENLESFTRLTYPSFEVLLGVESIADPAYAVACAIAARHPERLRVIIQHGAPGLNPKVNQLLGLGRAARHALLVISDSNVAVEPEYLHEIAAHLEDDEIGLVTHPIAGMGECSLGALLDNVHLSVWIGPSMIAANRIAGEPLVVGKSMALWRSDLQAIGGFDSVKDVLAEDFVIGRRIAEVCGKRVAVAHRPIMNISCRRTLRGFFDRYARWAVLQRTSVGALTYSALLLLNPLPLGLAALALEPTRATGAAVAAGVVLKAALEVCALGAVRKHGFVLRVLVALPLKDGLLLLTWVTGLVRSEVRWRGRRLAVLAGTRLVPVRHARPRLLPRKLPFAASRG